MRFWNRGIMAALLGTSLMIVQSAAPAAQDKEPKTAPAPAELQGMFERKVNAEWDAFKNRDKKAYSDLLADDFAAVEDDGQGMRTKSAAASEIDQSVVNSYNLFAFKVLPLNPGAALVTYELTMVFPAKAQVRFKRVLVSELWLKRDGQWKMRYYQETRTR